MPMSTLTFESSRFGTLEIAADAVIEFPTGLIGLGGTRYALVSADTDGAVPRGCTRSRTPRSRSPSRTRGCSSPTTPSSCPTPTPRASASEDPPDVWVTVRAGCRALGLQCEPPRADPGLQTAVATR